MIRLKALREEQEKTQAQMAEVFHISRQVYANYENGINEPSHQMLIMIADYFHCSIDYLLGRADDFGNITVLPEYHQTEAHSSHERDLLKAFRNLSQENKQLLIDYASFLQNKK